MAVHRIARVNYPIRTVAFLWSFVVAGLLLWERQAGPVAWTLAVLQFIVYPHLVYGLAHLSSASRRIELAVLYADSVLLGAWIAGLGFPAWPAFAAVFSTSLNNAVIRGWRGMGLSVLAFGSGAAAWAVLAGVEPRVATGPLVTALCFVGALIYACSLGVVVFQQNRRLREARDALRESQERYRLIAEHAGDLVALVDAEGRLRYASPSCARFFDPKDLVPGGDILALVEAADRDRVRTATQAALRTGETTRLRLQIIVRGGALRRFEAVLHPAREADGNLAGTVIAARDITELRDREEQLEVAAHAFEQMAEAMMITNAEGRILSVNAAFERLTGHAAHGAIGRPEAEFRFAMQPEGYWDEIAATVREAGSWAGTSWCRRADGTVYREWRSVSALRDREGRVTHHVSLFREVAEAELRAASRAS